MHLSKHTEPYTTKSRLYINLQRLVISKFPSGFDVLWSFSPVRQSCWKGMIKLICLGSRWKRKGVCVLSQLHSFTPVSQYQSASSTSGITQGWPEVASHTLIWSRGAAILQRCIVQYGSTWLLRLELCLSKELTFKFYLICINLYLNLETESV